VRRRPLGDWVMRVAQRYGCPPLGDVVEGRKSTVESVEEHWGARMEEVGGLSLGIISVGIRQAGAVIKSDSMHRTAVTRSHRSGRRIIK